VNYPTYLDTDRLRRDVKKQSILLKHFTNIWRHKHLTSLRDFYRYLRRGGQQINIDNVVLVHDDCVRVNWKLAVLERFVERKYGSLHSATIHTKNGVTNRPVSKLYPLEVTANDTAQVRELASQEVNNHPKRRAAEQARQQIMQWSKCIHAPLEDIEDSD